jgi:hypothetical protein
MILINKKLKGLGQLILVAILWWVFYAANSPGSFVMVKIARKFWRDPLMEAITGKNFLDTVVAFDLRLGQIIYIVLSVLYFAVTFGLLVYLSVAGVRNLFGKSSSGSSQ